MAWFEIENCNCILAIDYNCKIELNGSGYNKGFYLRNEPDTLLTPQDYSRVVKGVVKGVELNDNRLDSPLLSYKCLSFNKNNFTLPKAKTYGNSGALSIVLRCKLKSSSKFTVQSISSQGTYGLSYTTIDTNPDYSYLWRFADFNRNLTDVSPQLPGLDTVQDLYSIGFETVVLRLDYRNDVFKFSNRNGNFIIPVKYKSQIDLWNSDFQVLGADNSNPKWALDADIVAFGIWDKYLSDEEVENTLKTIDEEFLVETSGGLTSDILGATHSDSNILNETTSTNALTELTMQKPFKLDENKIADIDTHQEKIKDYTVMVFKGKATTIEDIVLKENEPVSVKLYLYERIGGLLLATTVSDNKGRFKFVDLDPDLEYVVTSHDPEYQFKSIIKNYEKV